MNQDEQNLNLLSIFHYIVGALTILLSCIYLIFVVMGLAMVSGKLHDKNGPPDEFGWFFFAMGVAIVLLGWTLGVLMLVAGRKLKLHKSRTFCLVIAGIECLLSPHGTILGVFTIVVLMKESVTRMFDSSEASGGLEAPE